MTAGEILAQLMNWNNKDVTKDKLSVEITEAPDYVLIEFGVFPENTFIVKETDLTVEREVLKERCFERILDFMIRKSISTNTR